MRRHNGRTVLGLFRLPPKAISALRLSLKDPNEDVRKAAGKALLKIGETRRAR
jgi:HEAT repeat protein